MRNIRFKDVYIGSFMYAVFVIGILFLSHCMDWIPFEIETIRNFMISLGVFPAFMVALWRSSIASDQRDSNERGQLEDFYIRSVQMLNSDNSISAISGIAALEQLSIDHPRVFYSRVVNTLSIFIRCSSPLKSYGLTDAGRQAVILIGQLGARPESIPFHLSAVDNIKLDECILDRVHVDGGNFNFVLMTNSQLTLFSATNCSMKECGFSYCTIITSWFSRGNLHSASFNYARILDSSFVAAKMPDVYMKHAIVEKCTFYECVLTNFRATETHFLNVDFGCADLSGANFSHSTFESVTFENANLSNVIFIGATFINSHFSFTKLVGANFSGADVKGSSFEYADLRCAKMEGIKSLTQQQLYSACQSEGNSPVLPHPVKQGFGLVWNEDQAIRRFEESLEFRACDWYAED